MQNYFKIYPDILITSCLLWCISFGYKCIEDVFNLFSKYTINILISAAQSCRIDFHFFLCDLAVGELTLPLDDTAVTALTEPSVNKLYGVTQ